MSEIAPALLAWFDRHGRHDLPWQTPRTPYRVWVSEIMLQQTQVATVRGYFQRFVDALPELAALAAAPEDQVLALWSGLGYYSRARNLHRAAKICLERHGGELPRDLEALAALPGIGRSTAGAILAQAHGLRVPILDGNVKRVLARYHGLRGWPGARAVEQQLWQFADAHTPAARVADYTQAIMDLGATRCLRARPLCDLCPLAEGCVARREHLTALLPERKPAKATPTRATCMVLLRDGDGRVLLERRGPTGVWAGLWSLPEAVEAAAAAAYARAQDLDIGAFDALPPFVHAFSHYRLSVQPLAAVLRVPPASVRDGASARWADAAALPGIGLPAPVRKLLNAYLETA
jgi:A/G-specific adenine glycosylase